LNIRRSKEIWIGLVEVHALPDAEVLRDVSGAYVNVLTWASSVEEYKQKIKIVMETMKLRIVEIEDAEPIGQRGNIENEEILDIVDRVSVNQNAIIYGTFQTWEEAPN
jgi:hypothetical protein